MIALAAAGAYVIDRCSDGSCGSTRPAERGGPDPGGAPAARPPVPPRGGRLFGWNTDAYHYNAGISPETEAAAAAGTGANAQRVPLEWRQVEPEGPGKISQPYVDGVDEMYRQLVEVRHMRPLILLFLAPLWARDPGPAQACGGGPICQFPPRHLADWRRFVSWAARRYPDADFEVWNEPNLKGSWGPEPDPARWADLVIDTFRTIKKINPGATVVAGGINGNLCDTCGLGLSAKTFMLRAYAARPALRTSMDALAFHPYPEQLGGKVQGLGRNSNYALQWARFNQALRAGHDSAQRIWVTETGVTMTGPNALSETDQAHELYRVYAKTLTIPRVDAVFLHTLVSGPPGVPVSNPVFGYGVMTNHGGDLKPRPAYCLFNRVAREPRAEGC